MVMCGIFVYTYIHIYYVCIHRQTNIQTYNSVCAYMYICTHNQPYDMDLFENGLDFSSAKKKWGNIRWGEHYVIQWGSEVSDGPKWNDNTDSDHNTANCTHRISFLHTHVFCVILQCFAWKFTVDTFSAANKACLAHPIEIGITAEKTQSQHKYQIIRHVSRAEQFPKFCANVPGQFHHQT